MNFEEELKDEKAKRRERKKRPRMRKRGQSLKKATKRTVLHIVKVERKKKRR